VKRSSTLSTPSWRASCSARLRSSEHENGRPIGRLSTAAHPASAPLARALTTGVRIAVVCARNCSVRAHAILPARLAKRLGIGHGKRVVIATAGHPGFASSRYTLSLRLTRTLRRRLMKAKRLTLQVVLVVADAAGNDDSRTTSLTLAKR
jgi:hypothetical protein